MDQHGWKNSGTRLDLVPGCIVWYNMNYNHQYRCWYPSQFINGCMWEIDTPLYNQQSKGVISILATQHYLNRLARRKENWHPFSFCLWWCVMYHELQPSIQMLTLLWNHQLVYGWDWYTIVQATKQCDNIHIGHTVLQRWTSMNGRTLAHFLLFPWMVCDAT